MLVRHEQTKISAFVDGRVADFRWVARLRRQQSQRCPTRLHQTDRITMLGKHTFHFQLREALIQFSHQPLEIRKLVGVGQHQRQPWLNARRQSRGSTAQPVRGAQQVIDAAKHDPSRFGQHRLP